MAKGLLIKEFLSLEGLVPLDVSDVPFQETPFCYACEHLLTPVCDMRSRTNNGRVRVGVCPRCGYVGYMDRPTDAWTYSFYDEVWDTQEVNETVKAFAKSPMIDFIKPLSLPLSTRIFDVGTGYGQILKKCKELGFTKLYGTEHSPHRALAAAEYAQATVVSSPFEVAAVSKFKELSDRFELIISKSVMEHMRDPSELFRTASLLQEEGDQVIVLVPNTDHEPVSNVALFLPHLHSFSERSLCILAARCGYETVTVKKTGKALIIHARKNSGISADVLAQEVDFVTQVLNRFKKEWCLDQVPSHPVIYWTNRKDNRGHGLVFARSAYLSLIARWVYAFLMLLPDMGGRVCMRLLLGIPRRHHALVVEAIDAPEGIVLIEMKKLFLWYK